MNSFDKLVLEKEKQQMQINLQELISNIKAEEYQYKIQRFAEKFGYDAKVVEQKILQDEMFACTFIKDPKKQNLTEKLVGELLHLTKLPASGSQCIRFNQDGELVSCNKGDVSKSADFVIDGVYYTQKYTREPGGAQDNQYNDVRDFLVKGSKKYKVGAIVDGAYWEEKRKQLELLFKNNNNVIITSVKELMEAKNERH